MPNDPVQKLEELLVQGSISPRIDANRIARSSFYDAAYRTCVIAMVLKRCGESTDRGYAFNHQKLRLFQFVAVHRGLLAPLQEWSVAFRADRPVSLLEWAGLPSGYATDPTYDRVLGYLLATGHFVQQGERIIWTNGPAETFIDELVRSSDDGGLFRAERRAIETLAVTKLTKGMLGS